MQDDEDDEQKWERRLREAAHGRFNLEELGSGVLSVKYTLSENRQREAKLKLGEAVSASGSFELLRLDDNNDLLTIFPLTTLPRHGRFLRPKYEHIRTVTLEGFEPDIWSKPEHPSEIYDLLEGMPPGLLKDPEYGLGIRKDYRFIVDAIEQLEGVQHLVLSKRRSTVLDGDTFVLSFQDFDALRRGINRVHDNALASARIDKEILAHNSLLTNIKPDRFPEKHRPYSKDAIVKTVSSRADTTVLSDRDQVAVVDLVNQNKRRIAEKHPMVLLDLQRDIELVTLECLIVKMDDLLTGKRSESFWQAFFQDNPFVLSLAFAFPVVAIDGQVSVGGRGLMAKGDKFADFLHRNCLTDNVALVEIKTPQTKLLGREYRGGVFPPSVPLAGAITQLLDQRYHLQTEIAMLKHNSGTSDLEVYAVQGVVIAGTMPTDREQQKSFEMYRNTLTGLSVVTFDELRQKLRALYELLKSDDGNIDDAVEVPTR